MNAGELGQRYFDALGKGDVDGALEALAPDVSFASPQGTFNGREAVRPFLAGYRASFPDARFEVKRTIVNGATAILEGTYEGTHTGVMIAREGAVPATNKPVRVPFVVIVETKDGLITAHRGYWDTLTMLAQLGLAK